MATRLIGVEIISNEHILIKLPRKSLNNKLAILVFKLKLSRISQMQERPGNNSLMERAWARQLRKCFIGMHSEFIECDSVGPRDICNHSLINWIGKINDHDKTYVAKYVANEEVDV